MAIDRTAFNATVDDTGIGNGTIVNKALIASVLLDPIDTAIATATPAAHATSHKAGGGDAIKLDELAAPTDVTTLNASTSLHGLSPKATAPASGLLSVHAIGNGETARTDKPLFDTTNPAALGTAGPGTALVAARRDHIHALPALDALAAPTDIATLNASTSAHGLLKKLSNVSTEFLNGQGNWAAPAGGGGSSTPTPETTTLTGTQNNYDLDAHYTYLRCNNASALVLTGFTVLTATPVAGDMVIIDNIGASTVKVAHEDTGSTAANRVICPSVAGQILGLNGRMLLVYDGTTGRWRESVLDPGGPIDVAYASGNFTADTGTWTVQSADQVTFWYQQAGRRLLVGFLIEHTTVASSPSYLQIAIPGGFVNTNFVLDFLYGLDNNVRGGGFTVRCSGGSSTLRCVTPTDAAWAAATNTTDVSAILTLLIN